MMTSKACLLSLFVGYSWAASPLVVDLTLTANENMPNQIKAQVCAGLMNRDETVAGSAYMLFNQYDVDWLADETGNPNPETTALADFMNTCVQSSAVKGYIRYNRTSQALIVPNIVTLAAMLDAVPLEDGDELIASNSLTMMFDALTEFDGFNSLNATKYMFEHYGDQTTTISISNPGYDQNVAHKHPFNPPLNGTFNPKLIDFIVKQKMFNFYFVQGCVRGTDEFKYWDYMVEDTSTMWPSPIPVYGYNNADPVAGDLFEAETDCNSAHNMGQIASSGVSNLAYFSILDAITEPLLQNPIESEQNPKDFLIYNESLTYFTIILGDGDNVQFVQESRRNWMQDRVSKCNEDVANCFPLVWTLSPHLTHIAPEWARWYYNQSYQTGHDYFVLPPSGDLYSYPGEMPPDVQANFMVNTERDCTLYNSSGTVHWEWFGTWTRAINNFLPQYATNGIVKGIFPVNVPYLFPMLQGDWKKGEHFHILTNEESDGKVVLFKPKEWRGTTCGPMCSSVEELVKEVNSYELGSVVAMYVTSDGGANIDNIFDIVSQLDDHVKMVDQETLVAMALQRGD